MATCVQLVLEAVKEIKWMQNCLSFYHAAEVNVVNNKVNIMEGQEYLHLKIRITSYRFNVFLACATCMLTKVGNGTVRTPRVDGLLQGYETI